VDKSALGKMKVVEDNKDLTIINHDTLIKIAKAQAKSKKKQLMKGSEDQKN
jgi:hypothetical protein